VSALASSHLFYSAGRIFGLLEAFEELITLAESPQTAFGLIGPHRDEPTPAVPKLAKQRGMTADPMRWADVHADVTRGVALLTSGGIGVEAIYAQMAGDDLPRFARFKGRPLDEVEHHHERAVYKLARRLEPLATASGAA
jgi:hypothetical protein